MRRIAFHFSNIKGHNFEFFVYYYEQCRHLSSNSYLFCMPEDERVRAYFEQNRVTHISLKCDELFALNTSGLKSYMTKYKIIKNIISKYAPTDIFMEYLMENIFSMVFLSMKKVKFHGIIYSLFLRKNKYSIVSWIQYILFKLTRNLKSVYILNDPSSARLLNKTLFTKKFKYLPDPVQKPLKATHDLDISDNEIRIVHLGALSKRKGTLELFEAIDLLIANSITKFKFTIAGSVSEDIRDTYDTFVNNNNNNSIVDIYAGFVSFEQFHEIIHNAHFVLLPYSKVSQSSGLIGFAALYEKPLIYPSKGLIGEIGAKYALGCPLDVINTETLYDFFATQDITTLYNDYKRNNKAKLYCQINSSENFISTIFSNFN